MWDHPRLRGEYSWSYGLSKWNSGSPPLARGVRNGGITWRYGTGITPACAGSTFTNAFTKTFNRDHPRLRGEYLLIRFTVERLTGSPPLARGVHDFNGGKLRQHGITPACAGSTIYEKGNTGIGRDHPRLRGEYLSCRIFKALMTGSPPLARGVPLLLL